MIHNKTRRLALAYPAGTLVNKFELFGFKVVATIKKRGRVEVIIEETDISKDYFSIILEGIKDKQFYYAYRINPNLELIIFQSSNSQQKPKTLP